MTDLNSRPGDPRPQTPELCPTSPTPLGPSGVMLASIAPSGNPAACILPPALRKPRLRRWEAAEYLELVHGVTVAAATLAKYASVGGGPSFNKGSNNRTPLYPIAELDRWALGRLGKLVSSTSDSGV